MKKVLLATSALVGLGAAATAEVSLSGSAEMGLYGGDNVETQFHSDMDVSFNLSGETDNGLSFGAKIDLDEVTGNGGISAEGDDTYVWISGAFGTVHLGDTDGAFDRAMRENGVGSSLQDDHTTHAGFNFNDGLDEIHSDTEAGEGNVLRYEYDFGDFEFNVSAELDDTANSPDDPALGLGVVWNGSLGATDLRVGVAYQTGSYAGVDLDAAGISLHGSFAGGFGVGLNYTTYDRGGVTTNHIGFDVSYVANNWTVGANYGEFDTDGIVNNPSGFGLVVNYDLGGGAAIQAGYGSSDNGTSGNGNGQDTFSLGLGLSF